VTEYTVDDLVAFLREQSPAFATAHGLEEHEVLLPELHPDEAAFLYAVHGPRSILRLGPGPAQFQLVGIDAASTTKSTYSLFSKPPFSLNRQYLIQVVALWRLTNDYGWRTSELQFERSSFDVLAVYERQVIIAVTADKSPTDLDRRVEAIRTRAASDSAAANQRDGNIAESLLSIRPRVFWAIAPGRSEVFDVISAGDTVALEPRPDVARRPS
jgi:hypothetical protein